MMMNSTSTHTSWSKHVQLDDQKRGLARLMARENITVEHGNYETAMFDIETRVLRLPMWENVTLDQYDLLIGHEVGHALYSDDLSYVDDCKANPGLHSFINVLEDVRIERRIKDAFPGMRGVFQRGYRDFYERGPLFQLDRPIAEYGFIDRVNIHAKIGEHVAVPFTPEERAILTRIESTRSMTEVIALAKELYGAAKQQQQPQSPAPPAPSKSMTSDSASESQPSSAPTANTTDESDESDASSKSSESSESESESDASSKSSKSSESSEDADADADAESHPADGDSDSESQTSQTVGNEPTAETDIANSEAMKTLAGAESSEILYVTHTPLSDADAAAYTVSMTEVAREAEKLAAKYTAQRSLIDNSLVTLTRQYAPTAAHMAREFDRRKCAKQLERARVASTGRLNLKKLPFYQFRDDLFQQVTILPNGQSHGLMLLIDGSGSMSSVFADVIEQVFLFGMFAKQARIPVQAFVFQTQYRENVALAPVTTGGPLTVMPGDVQLITVLDTTSSVPMPQQLRVLAQLHAAYSEYQMHLAPYVKLQMTPLYGGMFIMESHVRRMRKLLQLQKMTVLVLTDGEDSDGLRTNAHDSLRSVTWKRTVIRESLTSRTFVGYIEDANHYSGYAPDPYLLDRLMHHVYTKGLGVSLIRLFIGRDSDCRASRAAATLANALRSMIDPPSDALSPMMRGGSQYTHGIATSLAATLASEKIVSLTRKEQPSMFADSLVVVSNRKLDMQDESFEDLNTATMTSRRIMSAFTKSNVAASQNRVLVNAVMPFIA
jgi:hypothetical protein